MRLNTIFSIKPLEFVLIFRGVRLQGWGVECFTNLLEGADLGCYLRRPSCYCFTYRLSAI